MNARPLRRSSDIHATRSNRSGSEMKSIDLSDHSTHHHISTTPIHEYPVPQGRLPHSSSPPASAAPVASSSSFSSIMSSPLSARLTFQTLTNFIPLSWGPATRTASSDFSTGSNIHDSERSISGSHSTIPSLQAMPADTPRKRGYVAKEKQLEKLKSRFEREGTMKMRTTVNVCCEKCDDKAVCL
jgi:hypothetical protein